MTDLAEEIRQSIRQAEPTDTRPPEKRATYSGSPHHSYGISVPTMRQIAREWAGAHKKTLTAAQWEETLTALYAGESIEERQIAGILMGTFTSFRKGLSLDTFDEWLGQLVGWMEVDATCQSSFTSGELLARWTEWEPFLRRLARDANTNKRRASLVLFVKPIRDGDERIRDVALENAALLHQEVDKLISKAVSWVLREGTRHHSQEVVAFLNTYGEAMPAFVVREVRKKLDTGKK